MARPTLYQLQARWDAEAEASRTRTLVAQIRTLHRLYGDETPGLALALALAGVAFALIWVALP